MKKINENVLIDAYLEFIECGKIEFLAINPQARQIVSKELNTLRDAKDLHSKLHCTCVLWETLITAALSQFDSDTSGLDDLLKYFREFVLFEELIFATDPFYRDHTLHSLWAYLLHVFLTHNDEFSVFFKTSINVNQKIKDYLVEANFDGVFDTIIDVYKNQDILTTLQEALVCIEILAHDLGYPIRKIDKIQEAINDIIPYFGLKAQHCFEFKFTVTQAEHIDGFLKLLTTPMSITNKERSPSERLYFNQLIQKYPDLSIFKNHLSEFMQIPSTKFRSILEILEPEERDFLKNIYSNIKIPVVENLSLRSEYAKELANHEHGIMSAFILFRLLYTFTAAQKILKNEFYYFGGYRQEIHVLSIVNILTTIADHNRLNYEITSIKDLPLAFLDELEEFSRISKANQNRQYSVGFCETEMEVNDNTFNIRFVFNKVNLIHVDPERFFRDKSNRMVRLLQIPNLEPSFKFNLECDSKLPWNNHLYRLEISQNCLKIYQNGLELNPEIFLQSNEY